MFRIVIANHDELMNARLACTLESHDAVQVVGVATSGLDALDLVWECQPNVVVVGPVRPPMGGRVLLRLVQEARPRALLVALEEPAHESSCVPAEAAARLWYDGVDHLRLVPVQGRR